MKNELDRNFFISFVILIFRLFIIAFIVTFVVSLPLLSLDIISNFWEFHFCYSSFTFIYFTYVIVNKDKGIMFDFLLTKDFKSDIMKIPETLKEQDDTDLNTYNEENTSENINLIEQVNDMSEIEFLDDFINAIHENDIEIVKQLIKNVDINWQQPDEEYTFLHLAVDEKNIEVVKILIEAGADVTIEDVFGKTALQWAIESSNLEIAKFLLEVYIAKNLSYKHKTFCVYCKKFTDPELNK